MQAKTAGKLALNIALLSLATYSWLAKIVQDREFHDARMDALEESSETDDPDLITVRDAVSEHTVWHNVQGHLIQFTDEVEAAMGDGRFASWAKSYQDYVNELPHDTHPAVAGALQFYVDLQVENDKMLAARILEKVKNAGDVFNTYQVQAVTDLMEEVVDVEEARAS